MFEREIGEDDVRVVLRSGERIEDYPDDAPYPMYEPDPGRWNAGLRRRSKS